MLDVTDVPFVDSAGLGAVMAVLKRARGHRAGLSIAGAQPQLQQLLVLMGIPHVVALHTTAALAVEGALGRV